MIVGRRKLIRVLEVVAPPVVADWKQLKLGAGGWNTGIDIAADGTMVTRGDVFGAWLWSDAANKWLLLNNETSMPVADITLGNAYGCYEIRIAPSNTSIFYMIHAGYLYRSVNRGALWTRTSYPRYPDDGTYSANNGYRMYGPKMAVSPNNANHVIAGTPAGAVYQTFDGGTTWNPISGITAPTLDQGYRIIFVSPTEILIASPGTGVYRSTNTGSSFSFMSGSPTNVKHWVLDANSIVWAVGTVSPNGLWKCVSGTWTNITAATLSSGYPWEHVACDPGDANYIIVTDGGFSTYQITLDGGTTWEGIVFEHFPGEISIGDTSDDIPWIGNIDEHYLSEGTIQFHPVTRKLWIPMGIGVLYCQSRPDATGNVTLKSQSRGIESLVSNWGISPPGGKPIVFNWDRPTWRVVDPDVYPSGYSPNYDHQIIAGWGGDYASSDPTYIAALACYFGSQESGYSNDGGITWFPFGSVPTPMINGGLIGGQIAAATPTNLVWLPSNNGDPYNTKDGGVTWTQRLISGVPASPAETGWSYAYHNNSHAVCADRVLVSTFYMANYVTPGIYRSTDGGDTWVRVNSQALGWLVAGAILAIPGHAGHLILSNGVYSATTLKKSIDGGVTWNNVGNVTQSLAFGFGKQIGSGDDPTYYMVGYVSGVYGVWYSVDSGLNWISLDRFPLGICITPKAIFGDMNTAGRVYVALDGYGWAYRDV